MQPAPPPPWTLTGEAAAFLAGPLRVRLLVNYWNSPVGPYREHAIAKLTWRGPSIVQMGVDNADSMRGGRANWGYPKVLEDLVWQRKRYGIEFRRGRHLFRGRPFGPAIPVALPGWTRQLLNGEMVTVPCRIHGKLRFAFSGRQLAVYLEHFTLVVESPR